MNRLDLVRSALFLPASKARAVEKARTLPADLVILDLEDSVPAEAKADARAAALQAADADWGRRLLAVRVNGDASLAHEADVAALARAGGIALGVLPKAEDSLTVGRVAERLGRPLLAMIETPAGVYAAREIAALAGVAGLIVGTNDLAAELGLPADPARAGLALALQTVVLAARAAGIAAFDGVYNRLDDAPGFEAECRGGRALGFDGKTLIHPSQIEPANRLFGPGTQELDDARALVAAAEDGAVRFRDRMVEPMHVAQARRVLARADASGPA